jgi:hypothetical protein
MFDSFIVSMDKLEMSHWNMAEIMEGTSFLFHFRCRHRTMARSKWAIRLRRRSDHHRHTTHDPLSETFARLKNSNSLFEWVSQVSRAQSEDSQPIIINERRVCVRGYNTTGNEYAALATCWDPSLGRVLNAPVQIENKLPNDHKWPRTLAIHSS